MVLARPRRAPVPLPALPEDYPLICSNGVASVVLVFPPAAGAPGCALKVYHPRVACRARGARAPSTLPAAELELCAHLAARRALGNEYFLRVVGLQGPPAVFSFSGGALGEALSAALSAALGFRGDPFEAFALRFDYGGAALSANYCRSCRGDLLFGLGRLLGTLAAFRRRGLAHLDIKSENLLVLPGGGLRLADFGLASRARRSGGSFLENFLEDGRRYEIWPFDFYLASPRWRARGALARLAAASAELAAYSPEGDPGFNSALALSAELELRAADLAAAAECFLPYAFDPSGFFVTPAPFRQIVWLGARLRTALYGGEFSPKLAGELGSAVGAACAVVEARARPPSFDAETYLPPPIRARLAPYSAPAERLGVEVLWDGSLGALARYASGLAAACAAPGAGGALARFGSGVDVYMAGRLLLMIDSLGVRLPPGGVELACRMASLDPSRRPSAFAASSEFGRLLGA